MTDFSTFNNGRSSRDEHAQLPFCEPVFEGKVRFTLKRS